VKSNLWGALTRSSTPLTLAEYAEFFKFGGSFYPYLAGQGHTLLGSHQEKIPPTFEGYADQIFKANPIVFGCMAARLTLFSEARFKFREQVDGRPGDLSGGPQLASLEEPWPEAATSDLLKRMITDVDLAGNFYAARRPGGRIMRLRPDWVTIVLGSRRKGVDASFGDIDIEPVGYIYKPGGPPGTKEPEFLLAEEVAHFAAYPDPVFAFRGMSWLQPVLRDVLGDMAGTEHKLQFLEKGAVPNAVVTPDAKVRPEDFLKFKEIFEESRENPYETLFLGGGADYTVIGSDMRKIDFKAIQALGENRICVAARVPAIIAGVSEGLEAATYSNFPAARRTFTDGTMHPLWSDACAALAPLIDVPAGKELWFDTSDIPYLRAERKEEGEAQVKQAIAVKTYVDAGFTPESAQEAVAANDLSRLQHSGLVSVQLQKPGDSNAPPQPPTPVFPPEGED
jgi:Phage portal protein